MQGGLELDETVILDEDEEVVLQKLITQYEEDKEYPNILFKYVDNKRMKDATKKVNKAARKIVTNNISETNRLLRAVAWCTAEVLQLKERKKEKKEPWWKMRLQKNIDELRRDLSKLERSTKVQTNSSERNQSNRGKIQGEGEGSESSDRRTKTTNCCKGRENQEIQQQK